MDVGVVSKRLSGTKGRRWSGMLEGLESRVLLSVTHSDLDINGTWSIVGTTSEGSAQFNGAGIVTGGSVTDDSGTTNTPVGTYTVDASGTMSITVDKTSTGAINAANNVAAFSEVTGNDFNVIVSAGAATFSSADLSGTWTIAFNGDAPDSNGQGTLVFNGAGLITGGTLTQGNTQSGVGTTTTHVSSGNYTISSTGLVTVNVTTLETSGNQTSTFTGAMNASKDVLVLDPPNLQTAVANTDSTLLTLIHSVGKYSNADVAGTWSIVGLGTTGSVILDGAGHISGGNLDASGNTFALSGTYSVSSSGSYTLNTISTGTGASVGHNMTRTFNGAINGSRNVMAMNSVDATSSDNLTILINSSTVDHAPTLSTVGTFSTATELHDFTISYSELLASSNAADVDGDPISFLITSVGSGSLTVGGSAAVAGTTTVSAGQTISWTPAAGTKGAVSLFSIVASDGTLSTSKAVAVKVNTVLLPSITIVANKSKAAEGNPGVAGQFTLTRTGGDLTQSMTVDYGTSGSATNGAEYQPITGGVTFAANSKTATVDLVPFDSVLTEGTQTATLTISPSVTNVYTVGSKPSATVTITDHQLSPASVAGDTLTLTVSTGTAPFLAVGTYQVVLSPTTNSYIMVGGPGTASSSGTYTYMKIGSTKGDLILADATLGGYHGSLTFTSGTAATFSFEQDSGNGTQTGALKLVTPPVVGFAPATIGGRVATMKIVSSSGGFLNTGTFQTVFASGSSNYVIVGAPTVTNSKGTFSYQKFSANTAVVGFTDSTFGTATMVMVFTSATSASYVLRNSAGQFQQGTVTFAAAATHAFAPVSLSGHTLALSGTSAVLPLIAPDKSSLVFGATTYQVFSSNGTLRSSGTYTIELFNPTTLVVNVVDGSSGHLWLELGFTAATKASFIRADGADTGWLRGTAVLS